MKELLNSYFIDSIKPSDSVSSNNDSTENNESDFIQKLTKKITEVDKIFRSYYIEELDDDELIDYVVTGYVAGTGDKYGAYYNAESFQDFLSDYAGEFTGIGVNVIYNSDYKLIEVINVLENSPAEEAGILPGDLIYSVQEGDQTYFVSEIGYYPTIDLVRGEEGTYVHFTVLRGDEFEEIPFDIVRKQITEQTVMYHVYDLDNSVGIIKISGFDDTTYPQFTESIRNLKNLGCEKFVFDVRYNPGGELNSIVSILDYLLPEGPIVRIMDADGGLVKTYNSDAAEMNFPMAVVVNGSTASAAELFTSALKDYNKAVIVGTTTYGKGCMQTTIPLSDKSAVSVTYRMYNPPFSDNYHDVGVIPDIEIELDEALLNKSIYKVTDEEDNQIAAAVAAISNNNN